MTAAGAAALFTLVSGPAAARAASPTESCFQATVNAERVASALPPLSSDPTLVGIAEGWAGTMAQTGIFEHNPNPAGAAAMLLGGILVFFMLEKVLLWRHHHHHGGDDESEHGHGAHDHGRSGWMIVFGDSFHNFTDGVIIAGAFLADVRLGITTSLAIIAHEIPQEIGDFLILLHSGFSKKKALLLNLFSSLATVVGALLGYVMLSNAADWVTPMLALAAASMIYVAVADLIPGLHKKAALRETVMQILFILLGVGSIALVHELAGH